MGLNDWKTMIFFLIPFNTNNLEDESHKCGKQYRSPDLIGTIEHLLTLEIIQAEKRVTADFRTR